MYVTLPSMTWHSALHTLAFVYLPTTWVQLFGILVGSQSSANQDIMTNTTLPEVAKSFACTSNWASPICVFAGGRKRPVHLQGLSLGFNLLA